MRASIRAKVAVSERAGKSYLMRFRLSLSEGEEAGEVS